MTFKKYTIFLWMLAGMSSGQELFESFEGDSFWVLAGWGDQGTISKAVEHATDGTFALKVGFNRENKAIGKGIVVERDLQGMDLSLSKLSLDCMNRSSEPIQISIAIETDQYYESQPVLVLQGEQKNILYDLTQSIFKSNSTNWEFSSPVKLSELPKKILLIFYRPTLESGLIYVDNIRTYKNNCDCRSRKDAMPTTYSRIRENRYRPPNLPVEIFLRPKQ